ncbi:MAG: hypothetical protein HW378_3643 [Anaerolineales bacterium]|nr:hypothetical protein [Anaerolineales bacterium]
MVFGVQVIEPSNQMRFLEHFPKLPQPIPDIVGFKPPALSKHNAINIHPVFFTIGNRFVNDQILCCADWQLQALKFHYPRSPDRLLFIRQNTNQHVGHHARHHVPFRRHLGHRFVARRVERLPLGTCPQTALAIPPITI